jgi:hypothetical protein
MHHKGILESVKSTDNVGHILRLAASSLEDYEYDMSDEQFKDDS